MSEEVKTLAEALLEETEYNDLKKAIEWFETSYCCDGCNDCSDECDSCEPHEMHKIAIDALRFKKLMLEVAANGDISLSVSDDLAEKLEQIK